MSFLARFICRHPRSILFTALVLTGLSLWLATRLVMINDKDSLIRSDSPVNRDYLAYRNEFGATDEFVFVVRSPDPDLNRAVVDELGKRLRALAPEITNVVDRHDFSKLEHRALLLNNPDTDQDFLLKQEAQIEDLKNQAASSDVPWHLNGLLDMIHSKFSKGDVSKSQWNQLKPDIVQLKDMLNSLAETLDENKSAKSATAPSVAGSPSSPTPETPNQIIDVEQQMQDHEYNSFDNGKLLLVTAEPRPLPSGASTYTDLIGKLRKIETELRAQFPNSISITLTGEPVLDDDELQTTNRDSALAGGLAFLLVSILFFASYQALTRPALALLVLVMGIVISLGYTVLTVHHLNLISSAFIAMVVGLGIDFGIQIMGRYEEELAHGKSIADAVSITLQHTGLAILTGGSTTAIAFFTMCFNDFIGLAEFGVIAGGGILICLILSLTVLPALYVLRDQTRPMERVTRQAQSSNWSTWSGLNQSLVRYPKTILGLAIVLTALSILGWPKLGFDYNLLNLQNQNLESVKEARALTESSTDSIMEALSVADTLAEVRTRSAQFAALPSVKEVHSLADLLPPEKEMEDKLVIIRRIVNLLHGLNLNTDVSSEIDVEKCRAQLSGLLVNFQDGLKSPLLKVGVTLKTHDALEAREILINIVAAIQRALNAMANLSQQQVGKRLLSYQSDHLDTMRKDLQWMSELSTDRVIEPEDLPPDLKQRWLSPHGQYLIEIFPKENVWNRAADVQFVHELRSVDPHVTGDPVQNFEYIEVLRKSYEQAAWYSFAAIIILIGLHFRNVGYTLLTILPLALGILWTLGIMAWFNIPFNPANIVTLPLVIGIGVAYGVYTVDRYREDGSMKLFSTSTGKAITISALTAIIGFGSMMISSYQGLHSLGVVMSLGVSMCLISSLIVLPQILQLLGQRKKGNEEGVDSRRTTG